ncbi:alpha-1,3/1,6-mannosyltransferase ALG2 isoform X1 [Dendrobium catenatum]|uniref:Alpha-1,3/1,6-mannosyltransferase ALG2 n=2 Tax=Dendrobium catenatum TaxID=906689 RepID=A0A2I0W6E6_9ASPA|nr:alpha-1,3/1,6-mannosyltransferase ALG2 isoform X1 [Dendrobium catenatum]XP_028554114.1 alpha-1,3/1,6-mannosyltransferase ALG2 isoform X1 [Dendrobium catenatum]XP_028554115.1 alpha-1,3/1,6-mannosyltransferase ALG2 isoform X1 [Dendrobium catenatum]PKU71238.1 GDP-Man:Man(3)GlcNAc(2)-PP-Dol alpha-1,2-mannosyltransferase [Dendrobium catenatum]
MEYGVELIYALRVPDLAALCVRETEVGEARSMENKGHRKLKVAIIHPDLGIGGAERLIVDAAVELASHGHNVHVFTAHHDKSRCFEETMSGKFQVAVYGSFLPRHLFYRFHAVCAYIRCIFVTLCVLFMWPSFDIILADQVSVVVPLLKLKRPGKVIFYCHFPDLLLAQHTTWLRRMYRKPIDLLEEKTTGMANLILVNSRFTKSTFATTFRGLHSRGIEPAVLYPAVNVSQFSEQCSYKPNFLSINRFERKKNLQLAISAFALLSYSGTNSYGATLTIAGGFDKRLNENVEYLEELKQLAEVNGVSNRVMFVTSCSTQERNALLSQCLCVLYTPENEHFGIVPLEAMASQKPVIACNSGGPMETVKNEVTGFLCEPTPSEFSKAMAKLLSDGELAVRMGKEARLHVAEMFSTKTFGDQLNRYVLDTCHHRIE